MTFRGSNDLKNFGPRLGEHIPYIRHIGKKKLKSRIIGKGETHETLKSAFSKSFLL